MEKKREEAVKKKAHTDMVHKALLNEDKQVDDNIETAEMMIDNANDSLRKAIQSKDLRKAELAHALIQAAQTKLFFVKSNVLGLNPPA